MVFVSAAQVIEELFTYWNFEDADQTLEELEDALIVRKGDCRDQTPAHCAAPGSAWT